MPATGFDLVYRRLVYGVVLLLPIYRYLDVPVGAAKISAVDMLIAFGGLCLAFEVLLGQGAPIVRHRLALAGIVLFFFTVVVSTLGARYRGQAVLFFASLSLKLVLLYMVFRATREVGQVFTVMKCYVVVAAIIAVIAIFQQLYGRDAAEDALSVAGTFEARNELTFYLAPALVLSLALIVADSRVRVAAILAFALLTLALVLSRGRAGTLLSLAGVLSFLALMPNTRRKWKRVAAILGLLLLGTLAWWLAADSASWISQRYSVSVLSELEEERGSIYARLLILEGVWKAWQQGIWFGIGPANFRPRSAEFVEFLQADEVQPHNTYLGALAELGVLGLIGFLLISIPALRAIVLSEISKQHKMLTLGVGIAYAVVLAHLATFDGIARYPLWIFMGMCYGLTSRANERALRFC